MNDLKFDLVNLVTSKKGSKKNNIITVILFLAYIGLSALFIFVFQSKLIPLLLMIPFGIASYLASKKSKILVSIGTITMHEDAIVLVNEVKKTERRIELGEINSLFIRGGVEIHSHYLNKKSLFLDITLRSEELITAHIGVIELDEYTADLVTNFCVGKEITCKRKL